MRRAVELFFTRSRLDKKRLKYIHSLYTPYIYSKHDLLNTSFQAKLYPLSLPTYLPPSSPNPPFK